uniref:Uncharacterized protein n=1 Tax=Glossina pallidipes TaxID=7398 RepID=A0A1B0ACD9_GLOPL
MNYVWFRAGFEIPALLLPIFVSFLLLSFRVRMANVKGQISGSKICSRETNILNTRIVIVLNQSQFLFACEAFARVYLKVAAPAFTAEIYFLYYAYLHILYLILYSWLMCAMTNNGSQK